MIEKITKKKISFSIIENIISIFPELEWEYDKLNNIYTFYVTDKECKEEVFTIKTFYIEPYYSNIADFTYYTHTTFSEIEHYLKFLLKNHVETKKYREGIEEERRRNYYSWTPFGV